MIHGLSHWLAHVFRGSAPTDEMRESSSYWNRMEPKQASALRWHRAKRFLSAIGADRWLMSQPIGELRLSSQTICCCCCFKYTATNHSPALASSSSSQNGKQQNNKENFQKQRASPHINGSQLDAIGIEITFTSEPKSSIPIPIPIFSFSSWRRIRIHLVCIGAAAAGC